MTASETRCEVALISDSRNRTDDCRQPAPAPTRLGWHEHHVCDNHSQSYREGHVLFFRRESGPGCFHSRPNHADRG